MLWLRVFSCYVCDSHSDGALRRCRGGGVSMRSLQEEPGSARARFESRIDAWRDSALQSLDALASTRKVHHPHPAALQPASSHVALDENITPASGLYTSLACPGASTSGVCMLTNRCVVQWKVVDAGGPAFFSEVQESGVGELGQGRLSILFVWVE